MSEVHVTTHPLVVHKLTLMRQKDTSTHDFRRLLEEISTLMTFDVLADIPTQEVSVETPLEVTTGQVIDGKKLVFAAILRGGTSVAEGMMTVVPGARLGHIGLYRDPKTRIAVEYYFKMPKELDERDVVIVDPLLATGHSAVAAVDRIKEYRPRSIRFACLLACPEGIATLQGAHPDVPIYTAAIDRELDENGYIRPGLGDAGDRIYGTA
ncbi:uracil phosphoribosyltransferase [Dermacoccaceae bacterium W4C1]